MKKRGQNEGSIFLRKDGRYEAVMTVDSNSGKRKSFYGKTKKEAQEKLRDAQAALQKGILPSNDRLTVGQLLDDWLEGTVKVTCRTSTYESYEETVRVHLKPALGKDKLTKLSPQRVNLYLRDKHASGLSATTVHYHRAILRRALNVAIKHGHISRNVAALADPPKRVKHRVKGLEPEQARMLLEAMRGDRLEALFTIALSIGLRMGEVLALKWSDIDFDRGTVRVHTQLQRTGGKLALVEPKSESSRRTIPLPSFVCDALRNLRARQEIDDKRLAGDRWREEGFVFTSRIGTPLEQRNVRRSLAGLLHKAGLPHMRFHDFRHGCATLLIAQNVNPRVVMEILGHSQIGLTMNTYSHAVPSVLHDAAQSMDSLLKPKPSGKG